MTSMAPAMSPSMASSASASVPTSPIPTRLSGSYVGAQVGFIMHDPNGALEEFSSTLAHEVGHVLRLEHDTVRAPAPAGSRNNWSGRNQRPTPPASAAARPRSGRLRRLHPALRPRRPGRILPGHQNARPHPTVQSGPNPENRHQRRHLPAHLIDIDLLPFSLILLRSSHSCPLVPPPA